MKDTTSDKSGYGYRIISILTVFVFFCMVLIPLSEALNRRITYIGIPGAANWTQHLVLWLGLLGGILATLKKRHLAIAATKFIKNEQVSQIIDFFTSLVTVMFLIFLTVASVILVKSQMQSPEKLGGWLPIWLAQAVIPAAFLCMALATIKTSSERWQWQLVLGIAAFIFSLLFIQIPDSYRYLSTTPFFFLVLISAFLGMPLYAVLGGVGLLLFFSSEIPIAALPYESYRIMTQPVLPSIPLFALSGTILANGGAPRRLIRFITAWTSWIPGGTAIAAVVACALFTAITGASGVTILALGGLLLPVLIAANYEKQFSIGLLTSSGSVGLLFPPSLPVILYGIYGHVAIDKLFLSALFPGIFLIFLLSAVSLYIIRRNKKDRKQFNFSEGMSSLWAAKGDLMLPIIIIAGLFGGVLTLVETAALTVLWSVLLETVFHRELTIGKGLSKTFVEASVLVGALLLVLGLASGLVSYIVDAQIPFIITDWVLNVIQSKILFLLFLNCILLLVGAIMDIFSAIVVVVPLIVPIGNAFGIDPVHLGVIFLANLELGYLTPPIGINLFLSSLRFNKSLIEIWHTVVPFLIVFISWVLLITYVPSFSIGFAKLLAH